MLSIRCTRRFAAVLGCCWTLAPAVPASLPLSGSGAPAGGVLRFLTGEVDTSALPNLLYADHPLPAGPGIVIQLDGAMTPARAAQLAAAGVVRFDYLPDFAYLADVSGVDPADLRAMGFVRWIGSYEPAWKINPQIGTHAFQTAERLEIAARGELALSAYVFPNASLDAAIAQVAALPSATVVYAEYAGGDGILNFLIRPADVPALALIAEIQYVEEYPELTFRNNTDRWIVQSNQSGTFPCYANGIHGEGQFLGHMDGRIAVNHCSFQDGDPIGDAHRKIQAYNQSQGYELHGTHTAGTAVGDGGSDSNTRGVAYLAKVCHHGIPSFSESGMFNRLDLHRTQGATMHTNSWGNDGTTQYDGLCRGIDNFSWQFDEAVVCFAVTNQNSLKNPENAKNCLAVGASQDTPNQHQHCSGGAGPTSDGRRKPEVYAPGCSTTSSSGSSGCNSSNLTGTSMACPAVTGAALLVRQYFVDGYYPSGAANAGDGFIPSGALVKAIILNGAVDMTGISGYPSNSEGWGRILLDNALFFAGDSRSLVVKQAFNNSADALSTGNPVTYNIDVTSSGEPLRVTLVFHDAPGAAGSGDPVVNNLNLTVTDPNGTVYRGNVFSGGQSTTGGSADEKNNVEQVYLTSPITGTWEVKIGAPAVNTGSQGYGLAIAGAVIENTCQSVTIDQQPDSQSVCSGSPAAFAVVASGTAPLTYQWRKNGADVPGANAATLSIPGASPSDAGSYDCVVANACSSQTSAAATLTVHVAPDIDTHPQSQSVPEGDPVLFSVTAGGTAPLAFQWRKNTTDIPGATATTYSIAAAAPADAGNYDCVVTNACGSQTSDPALLTVIAACNPCDANCDGSINGFDVDGFIAALGGAPDPCSACAGDVNDDGTVNGQDIGGFIECLGSP